MLRLHTNEERKQSQWASRGTWYELAPGPDDQRFWASDGAFFWMEDWESVGEQIIGHKLPRYDRHDRINADTRIWQPILAHVDDVTRRLRDVDEPAMVHVLLPELDIWLRYELARDFPRKLIELAEELETINLWLRQALKRWGSVTFIGL